MLRRGKLLEIAAESPASGARFVGTLLTLRLARQNKNALFYFSGNPHTRVT